MVAGDPEAGSVAPRLKLERGGGVLNDSEDSDPLGDNTVPGD